MGRLEKKELPYDTNGKEKKDKELIRVIIRM